MGVAETYSDYMPSKLKVGMKHPDAVVESTSLSSVEPTDVWYRLNMPQETISQGKLSALQLEAVTYACQQHANKLPDGTKAGFLIGDGAGVGKGRTIAGIIFENYLAGRKKSIWVSVNSDLKYDAERDLRDVGAEKIKVFSLSKFKYSEISSAENGRVKKGVVFATYSALIAKTAQSGTPYKTRLHQLLDWCGPNFDGVLVFDECHKAKNLCPRNSTRPTKTGTTVLELQNSLPAARVVYASATGATEPRNMAYMVRLGMWGNGTPYDKFSHFMSALQKGGVAAMEIVAMDMKMRGLYIARQLSFHGVTFKIIEVPLTPEIVAMYDESTRLWVEALSMFREAARLVEAEKMMTATLWSQFWSSHQRFFKYLCISAKVKKAASIAREAVKCGKCVVIGLQSTGEARTLEQLEKEDADLTDFVSTAKGVLQTLVEKHFPAPDRSKVNRLIGECEFIESKRKLSPDICPDADYPSKRICVDVQLKTSFNENDVSKACAMKEELLAKIEKLGEILPPNALDDLIDELGGADTVAEMTGRKGRVIHSEDGFQYESRSEDDVPLETLNLIEKQRFMGGEKDIAIISEAASSGISLHSDRRVANKKRRVHITLELPWSADRAIQQFGRTHRSNQVNAPEYIFLISNLAGERRFASIVAKRLESLGALTHGDRRATETRDLSMFNIDNNYGRQAMEVTMRTVLGLHAPLVPPPSTYEGNFMADVTRALIGVGLIVENNDHSLPLDTERRSLSRFLNRILGMPVNLQNCLFEYFTDTMDAIVAGAKKGGNFDPGILDVGSNARRLSVTTYLRRLVTGLATTLLYRVSVERGMSWEDALALVSSKDAEGFFMLKQTRNGRREVIAVIREGDLCAIYRPNIGLQMKRVTLEKIKSRYNKIENALEVRDAWSKHYTDSKSMCSHIYWNDSCRFRTCGVGLRRRTYNILSGSVLCVWAKLESVLQEKGGRLQVVRLRTSDGHRIVGTLIPSSCVPSLHAMLSVDAQKIDVQVFFDENLYER
ncbi:hypothetical protein AAG570_012295 [Ranatra chinensis]|uniref:Uncharacterized protein n=1 Tax=Ranatra chinensis TaxID=642074 RepID=A0ABD0YIE5_9HEMI